ncbi:MAG: hypothetical protein JSR46_06360 [Verrucomicrobia bacterium]|nr:hypothetical protein [Verrucomicrobiota bacterium]
MCIQAIQTGCQDIWNHDAWDDLKPYVMTAVIGVGVAFVVSQVWGGVAAVCFLAGSVGFAAAFPSIITQITKDDLLISLIRAVMLVVLPFFGPLGILGSVSIAVISEFASDIRLFTIREKLSACDEMLGDLKKKLNERTQEREAMLVNAEEICSEGETYLQSLKTDEEVLSVILAFKDEIEAYKGRLREIVEKFQTVEREHDLASVKEQTNALISDLKEFI